MNTFKLTPNGRLIAYVAKEMKKKLFTNSFMGNLLTYPQNLQRQEIKLCDFQLPVVLLASCFVTRTFLWQNKTHLSINFMTECMQDKYVMNTMAHKTLLSARHSTRFITLEQKYNSVESNLNERKNVHSIHFVHQQFIIICTRIL